MRQSEDYWIGTAPLSITVFVVLHLLKRLTDPVSWLRKVSDWLGSFGCFWFLWASLIADNLQYLSYLGVRLSGGCTHSARNREHP